MVAETAFAAFALALALRFAFDLFCLPFIHSSTAANLSAKSFVSTYGFSSCGSTSNGLTYLLPF